MLAPNQVSAPAAMHTSTIPPKLGTARLTSDGCTKIELPTIVPTTIATACTRPIERVNFIRARIAYTRARNGGPREAADDETVRERRADRAPLRRSGTAGHAVDRVRAGRRHRLRGRPVPLIGCYRTAHPRCRRLGG